MGLGSRMLSLWPLGLHLFYYLLLGFMENEKTALPPLGVEKDNIEHLGHIL